MVYWLLKTDDTTCLKWLFKNLEKLGTLENYCCNNKAGRHSLFTSLLKLHAFLLIEST